MVRAALLLFLLGATLGTALDAIHTHSGTTEYTHVLVFKMAWWTPLLFGAAAVSVGTTYPVVERIFRLPAGSIAPIPSSPSALRGLGVFVLLYFASGYMPVSSKVKLALIFLGAIGLGLTWARTAAAFALGCGTAAVGSFVEISLIRAGEFRYLEPEIWGIPIWLPALYLAASFAVGVLGARLVGRPASLDSPA